MDPRAMNSSDVMQKHWENTHEEESGASQADRLGRLHVVFDSFCPGAEPRDTPAVGMHGEPNGASQNEHDGERNQITRNDKIPSKFFQIVNSVHQHWRIADIDVASKDKHHAIRVRGC